MSAIFRGKIFLFILQFCEINIQFLFQVIEDEDLVAILKDVSGESFHSEDQSQTQPRSTSSKKQEPQQTVPDRSMSSSTMEHWAEEPGEGIARIFC